MRRQQRRQPTLSTFTGVRRLCALCLCLCLCFVVEDGGFVHVHALNTGQKLVSDMIDHKRMLDALHREKNNNF